MTAGQRRKAALALKGNRFKRVLSFKKKQKHSVKLNYTCHLKDYNITKHC